MSSITLNKKLKNTPLTNKTPQLKHIWEILPHFKCPVIGACLTVEEHKKILKKAGYQTKRKRPHELHRMIMERLDKRNRLSEKVDRFLRHKYRKTIAMAADMKGDQLMEAWREGFQAGKMDGFFYVMALRNNISDEHLMEIFGETHMLCHANLAEVMNARRDVSIQLTANQKLAKLVNREKKRVKTLKQKNALLETSLNETRTLLTRFKKAPVNEKPEKKDDKKYETENQRLREKLRKLETQNANQADQLIQLEREKRRLQIELFDHQSKNQILDEEINSLIARISFFVEHTNKNCNDKCPQFKLCAKRILIVGGITKLKHLYRDLIESSGGEFDYHDGYMNNGKQNLEARVKRSDLIICPVNCNSHGACHRVKKLCQKHSKSVKMLPSSSLSAITEALYATNQDRNN